MRLSYKQLLLGELVALEVLQVVSEPRSRVQTPGVSLGGDCWQIGGLAASINSPCVHRGRLGECTISLGYAPFLTAFAFRRVGNVWGHTSGIRAEVMGSNPRGVVGGRLLADRRVGRAHQLPLCSPWAFRWMHYKAKVCAFPNSICF